MYNRDRENHGENDEAMADRGQENVPSYGSASRAAVYPPHARPKNLSALWLFPFLGRGGSSNMGMSLRSSTSSSLPSPSSSSAM